MTILEQIEDNRRRKNKPVLCQYNKISLFIANLIRAITGLAIVMAVQATILLFIWLINWTFSVQF